MGTHILSGFGEIQLIHPLGGLFIGGFAEVDISGNNTVADATRLTISDGQSIISDSRIAKQKYTLKITQETQDFRAFEMAANEMASVQSATYYALREATVPTSTPYEVNDTDIATGNLSQILATFQGNGPWNLVSGNYSPLNIPILTSGTTPSAGTSIAAAGKLSFNAAQAGAPIAYSIPITVTGKKTIGIAAVPSKLFNNWIFSCKIFSAEFPNGLIIMSPSCSKTSPFAAKSADVSILTHEFTMGVAPGKRTAYQIIEL